MGSGIIPPWGQATLEAKTGQLTLPWAAQLTCGHYSRLLSRPLKGTQNIPVGPHLALTP